MPVCTSELRKKSATLTLRVMVIVIVVVVIEAQTFANGFVCEYVLGYIKTLNPNVYSMCVCYFCPIMTNDAIMIVLIEPLLTINVVRVNECE